MHLKSLTVRGFKSFASATTFEFEPGVTAVVGPNGSGKSNVVDALSWVMGEQGAKTLRGGKMEDVIFAGTSGPAGRAALGRAHVSLTIDNSDGALPIDYSEVTISRTLFRSGGSEYAINGASCRLLDIQELLSDSGLGREMHVIVGQGQLDRILHATAEDRRGFIEEAAGVLKHRRRREKTVRKLDAMQGNLARLQDLTTEIRRQLTPLGKQADVARRAQTVQFEVRDARSRLLADELVTLRGTLERELADEQRTRERRAAAEQELRGVRARLTELELAAAAVVPELNAARESWYGLGTGRERFRSLAALAEERTRLLGTTEQPTRDPAREPDRLEQQAERLSADLDLLHADLAERRRELADTVEARSQAEAAAAAEEKHHAAALRAASDRREGLARLTGQVGTARSRLEAAHGELGRLRESAADARARREAARERLVVLEEQAAGVEESEEDLDAEHERAEAVLEAARTELRELRGREAEAVRECGVLQARIDALASTARRKDASEDVLAAGHEGISGRITARLGVRKGYEAAIAAALGPYAEALTALSASHAHAVVDRLRIEEAGRVHIVFPAGAAADDATGSVAATGSEDGATSLPHDLQVQAVPAGELVAIRSDRAAAPAARAQPSGAPGETAANADASTTAPADAALDRAVRALLRNTVVVADADGVQAVLDHAPQLRVVTRNGDLFTSATAVGGSGGGSSLLEQQAEIEESTSALRAAQVHAATLGDAATELARRVGAATTAVDAALQKLYQSDARITGVAEELNNLGAAERQAAAEEDRAGARIAAAEGTIAVEQQALEEIAERLAAAEEAPELEDPEEDRRGELQSAAAAARQRELDARLSLRGAEEQAKTLEARMQSLRRAAATERAARQEAEARAARRRRQAGRARAVAAAAQATLSALAVSLEQAAIERDRLEARRQELDEAVATVRTAETALAAELETLTNSVHRDELARAEQRLRIEALEVRAIEELGMTAEYLVEEFGPHLPVPLPPNEQDKWAALRASVDEEGRPVVQGRPFDRAEQQKRLKKAERDLAALGKVNPLALEEFAALEERHTFLTTQLEDLKSSRKDLLDIIREVDERVERVFSEAYADTAAQFERVFGRLFPGGEGRLVLTDPEDMLTTGIDIEARPAGKKIKRLSLLSGGERSLTAVALLVAIFKARPSPFYVMDEVEAALDDTNLGRLITIFEELRETSQLIVITHQKRTMEVADALYGVTMRGDGVTRVISQRLS